MHRRLVLWWWIRAIFEKAVVLNACRPKSKLKYQYRIQIHLTYVVVDKLSSINHFKIFKKGNCLSLIGLNRTGHMSFLTGQDRTPKFAGQVLPDRTESGPDWIWRPGRKTSGFRTVRILKICRTSGPDVMSGRALPASPVSYTHLTLPTIYSV